MKHIQVSTHAMTIPPFNIRDNTDIETAVAKRLRGGLYFGAFRLESWTGDGTQQTYSGTLCRGAGNVVCGISVYVRHPHPNNTPA